MQRRETKSSLVFRHWLRAFPQETAAFEMKDTGERDYLNFAEVKSHQIEYGQAIKSNQGVLIRVLAQSGEPDYIYLRNEPSYIAIKYPTCFVIIDVDEFDEESRRSKRRSLTLERAKEICKLHFKA